jgi:hypothetical protein
LDWIRQALTRKVHRKGTRNKEQVIVIEPNETLVYVVKFALGMTICLVAVEIAHLAILRTWNSEVFSAITGLVGTVTGIIMGQKA